jgi:hypothetical protein
MKIFIVFSENIVPDSPKSSDIILSKFKSLSAKYGDVHKLTENVLINDPEFLRSAEVVFEEYISLLPKYLQDIFISSKTSLYFVMIALENWRRSLDNLISEYPVEEIVFTEIIHQDFYLPFYEAEGEVTKALSYEPYDFISIALCNFVKSQYPAIKITVVKEHSKLKLRKRIFVRRYVLLLLKVLLQGWQCLKAVKFSLKKARPVKPVIFLSRSVAHSQYVVDYVKEFTAQSELYISDGLRTIGKNAGFLSNYDQSTNDYINSVDRASFFTFISSTWQVLLILVKYKIFYKRKLKPLDEKYGVSYSSSITEMIIHYLETHVYVANLETLVRREKAHNNLPKVLITCEIYTQYTYFIAKLGAKYNIKTIQLISVAMNTAFLPQYFFCDKVLFNQVWVMDKFKQNHPYLASKCAYWGSLSFNELQSVKARRNLSEKLSVIFFSQPVIDEENDFIILDCLREIKQAVPIEILVKQHPREKPEKFSNYINDIKVFSGTASLNEVVEQADLAIVKFSAVEHYLLNYGIPTIYCAFSKVARSTITNITETGYKGIAYTPEELKELVIDFPAITAEYIEFRKEEMFKRFENKGIFSFNENLVRYIND